MEKRDFRIDDKPTYWAQDCSARNMNIPNNNDINIPEKKVEYSFNFDI